MNGVGMPEIDLVALLMSQIKEIKTAYPGWQDPYLLAVDLGIDLIFKELGPDCEGATLPETIILNPSAGTPARRRFTCYHEISHHLVKKNDELLSILHDQYRYDKDFARICEHLCNAGAAEFVIPAEVLRAAIETTGFSLAVVEGLQNDTGASLGAICFQLATRATHRCITTVCSQIPAAAQCQPTLLNHSQVHGVLHVTGATSSPCMKYSVARGTIIPKGHLFSTAYAESSRKILRAPAPIPFRNGRYWEVECEAVRIGTQVLGLFHVDAPPRIHPDQLCLPFS